MDTKHCLQCSRCHIYTELGSYSCFFCDPCSCGKSPNHLPSGFLQVLKEVVIASAAPSRLTFPFSAGDPFLSVATAQGCYRHVIAGWWANSRSAKLEASLNFIKNTGRVPLLDLQCPQLFISSFWKYLFNRNYSISYLTSGSFSSVCFKR